MVLNPSIQLVFLRGLLRSGISTGLFLKLYSIAYFNIVVVKSTCSVPQGDSVSWMVHVVVGVSAFGQTLGTSVGTRLVCFSGLGHLCNCMLWLCLLRTSPGWPHTAFVEVAWRGAIGWMCVSPQNSKVGSHAPRWCHLGSGACGGWVGPFRNGMTVFS